MIQPIDITDLVEKSRTTFVDWAVAYMYGEEIVIPGLAWVALPVISDIDKEVLRLIVDELSKSVVMLGFFANTAIRKADQSQNFLEAEEALRNLPAGITSEGVRKLEAAKIAAFAAFVSVAN